MQIFATLLSSTSKSSRANRLGRIAAYLQLIAYKLALVLLLASGSLEGGLIEEAPASAFESFKDGSGCSTLFRTGHGSRDHQFASGNWITLDIAAKFSLPRQDSDLRHYRFSLPNGGRAPLRC